MANGNQLPSGFVLDQPQQEIPEGFQLDAPVEESSLLPSLKEVDEAFLKIPGAPAVAELSAALGRGLGGVVDFFGSDTINAVLELSGSGKRVPTARSLAAPAGSFAEPSLGRDVLITAGETAPAILGLGAALRQAASRIPATVDTVGAGVTKQLGATAPAQDLTVALSSAAGAEAGEEIGGETGRFIGALAAPIPALAAQQAATRTAQAVKRGVTGEIPASAQQTIRAGEAAGVPVLTTDVVPPKGIVGGLARQAGERIPVFGTSGKRAAQQSSREAAVVDFANSLPRATADDIVSSLKAQKDKVKSAAGNRLKSFKVRLDERGPVSLSQTNKAIDDAISRLDSVKIEKDVATIQKLADIKEGAAQEHTFSMLRDARTAVREAADSSDPLIRTQLPSKSATALKSVERAITRDLDAFVQASEGQSALKKYKQADQVYRSEAVKLTKSRLKSVLDKGDITPEVVNNMLFSRKPSEVRLLHDSLTAEGKQAARASLIREAIEKSGGIENINPTTFGNQLKRIQDNTGIFFKGKEREKLKGLQKLLIETKRAQEAAVVTPTGQSLTAIVGLGAGAQVGLIESLLGAATAGGAARVYESAAVRNFLLRMGRTPRNSPRFDKLIKDSLPQITAAVIAAQKEGSEQ